MSTRFPWPTKSPIRNGKIDLSWWRANADDPPPPGYNAAQWAARNPWHNFTWYVAGCADRWRLVIGRKTNWNENGGWHVHLVLDPWRSSIFLVLGLLVGWLWWPPAVLPLLIALGPYVSYKSAEIEAYIGIRFDGAWGARPTWKKP